MRSRIGKHATPTLRRTRVPVASLFPLLKEFIGPASRLLQHRTQFWGWLPFPIFETQLGSGGSTTQVDYPTTFKGSNKVKITGVPGECTNSAFKVKAKSKKANRVYVYLKGPTSEFGDPLPVSGVSGGSRRPRARRRR